MDGDNFFFTFIRVKQVMALAPRLRAAGLDPYDYAVLLELARRMAQKTVPEELRIIDTCFPTMKQIADGSVCQVRRVGTAIANLKRCGLLEVSKWKDSRGVEHNRYHVTPIWDTAFTPTEKIGGDHTRSAPVLSEADLAADKAFLDALDTTPAKKDSKPPVADDKYGETDAIIALLRTHFGDHTTFQHKDAIQMMTSCVRACIDIAGPDYSCLDVFHWTFDNEKTRVATANSRSLGGYIRAAFPGWFAESKVDYAECQQASLDELCQGDGREFRYVCSRSHLNIKSLCDWLREHLGSDLLELVDDEDDAARTENTQVVMFRVSDEYRAARRLALNQEARSNAASPQPVSRDREEEDECDPYDDDHYYEALERRDRETIERNERLAMERNGMAY
jgi:hypothetical protein